jgi:hypothetical protein
MGPVSKKNLTGLRDFCYFFWLDFFEHGGFSKTSGEGIAIPGDACML